MKTAQRMKNTQMSTFCTECIASEYSSPNKAADGDFLFLMLHVLVQSLRFVSCVILFHSLSTSRISVLSASLQGLLFWFWPVGIIQQH